MKNNENKTDWTFVLTFLILCATVLLSGAKCTYHPTANSVATTVAVNVD